MLKKELIKTYAESIESERSKLGLTQSEMAKELDMSLSNYKKIISGGTSSISLYVAHRMHELTGKWTFELCGEHSEELEIMQKIRSLSDSQRRFIDAVLDIESEMAVQRTGSEDYISVFVPTGNMEDGMIYDSSNVIKVNAAEYRKRFGESLDYGVEITSSHLHPVYNTGDIVLVSRSPIRDGDTGIFYNKETGRMYVRKLIQTNPCTLAPINGYGSTLTIDQHDPADMAKWFKAGRVLCKMRT